MVSDAIWESTVRFKDAIGPISEDLKPPFVMLRTCKSESVVGLGKALHSLQIHGYLFFFDVSSSFNQEPGQEQKLQTLDANWRSSGKFGMIQFFGQ